MRLPEHVEQLFIGNFRRIKLNLRDFGVAGVTSANLFVSRVCSVAARKTAGDGDDAGQAFVDGIHAPKTAATKRGDFDFVRFGYVHRIGCGTGQRGEIQCARGQ